MGNWGNDKMEIHHIPSQILAYALNKSSPEPELLKRLRRETHLKVLYARMLSSPFQGRLLAMLSRLIRPKRILEVGTFTGYSTICLAEGLKAEGKLITLEKNIELKYLIEQYLKEACIFDRVELNFGDALESIPQLADSFDLVFLDADKANYLTYYELILPKLHKGSLLIADNVLWYGKVLDENAKDKESRGIRSFNDFVSRDERVSSLLLPIEDGLMLVWKK